MGWLMCLYLLIFLLHSQVNCSSSFSSNSSSIKLCPRDQSLALIHFKNNFSFNKFASSSHWYECGPHSYPKMLSWEEGTDCCSWDGVTCDRVTGHVIGVDLSCSWLQGTIHSNSSLFLLPHLQWLNLAFNDFNRSQISSHFGRFASLMHLNLSSSVFYGHIPSEISHLSKLVSLDFSANYDTPIPPSRMFSSLLRLDTPNFKKLVQNITKLRQLNLRGVDMSMVELGSLRNLSSSLTSLNLRNCGLHGKFPNNIFHLPNLQMLILISNPDLTGYFPKVNWSSPFEILDLYYTNFLGEVPGSIGNLQSLKYLNLSSTSLSGEVPDSIGNLQSLNYLDLSSTSLSGEVPGSIGNLQSLNYLNLSSTSLSGEVPGSIGNLQSLNYLDLSSTSLSGEVPGSIGNLQSLNYLILSSTSLSGEVPDSIGNLQSLNYLDLQNCNFSGSIPASLRNLIQITYLDLSINHFTAEIPSSLSNLRQLNFLSLRSNSFSGQVPPSVANLTRLVTLDLSSNLLVGPIPSQAVLPNLNRLDLRLNSLNGTIPSWLFILPSLVYLDLSHNQLSGHIHEFQYNSLQDLYLGNNELHGPIPTSIFQLVNLIHLQLFSNNLSGIVELDKFTKLENLQELNLSDNSLSLSTNNNVNSILPKISSLRLGSCNLNEFPNFLRTMKKLEWLSLSNNKIHGQIPNWVWDMWKDSMIYLNLSSNFITGEVQIPWKNLINLDLHSNLLQGPLPVPPLSTIVFLISNNKLIGKIPYSICNVSFLKILDLSNNSLSGIIPECLGNFSNNLSVLDLRMNSFHGTIPGMFAKGNNLRNIALNGNQLKGSIPRSLINCKKLQVLDLGNNMIKDTFPYWLETLPKLQVIVLRFNRFHGSIRGSKVKHPFPKLRIFDLSHNEFTGLLPTKYFKYLKAMMNVDEEKFELRYIGEYYYQDSVMVTIKGLDIVLMKILTIFTALDLSNNRFQGKIPKSIGNLTSLRLLNFSHNSFTGHIPSSLENLRNLESLDLSSNNLIGEIPGLLTSLTFLAFLNLSQNHLVGPIPRGKQFDTFQNDSYNGNLGLCGVPLSRKCNDDEAPQPPSLIFQEEDDLVSANGFQLNVVFMGYGVWISYGISYIPNWKTRMACKDR